MNPVLQEILHTIEASADTPGYLDAMFGDSKAEVLQGHPVVIFGSGSLGQEMHATLTRNGVHVVAFCDNDERKTGQIINGLEIISFAELLQHHRTSLIVIAVLNHRTEILKQLIDAGLPYANLAGVGDLSDFICMYSMFGSQVLFTNYAAECRFRKENYRDFLIRNQGNIAKAHDLLDDQKSKSLLTSKLALMGTDRNFDLFRKFISQFSEPYREFGLSGYMGTPEDHYYFNNDMIKLEDGEIYVDIGAYDGDTVETFSKACLLQGIRYRHIYAFEPDPSYYERLCGAVGTYNNISCHKVGLWSQSSRLRFTASDTTRHDQTAGICTSGNIEIDVISLDDFLESRPVTLIKADPGNNIMPHVLKGAANSIRRFRPKLAVGAYHGIGSIFEVPLIVHELSRDYRIALRHNTYHLCDTDLFAVCANE